MLRKKLLAIGGTAAFALTLILSANLTSAATPAEMIAQRKALMSLQGGATLGMVAALKNGDTATIAKLARYLGRSAKVIPTFFEKGTDALPVIWEKWDEFKAAAATLQTESDKLEEIAKSGDQKAIAAQFDALGKACDGCHDKFSVQ